MALKKRKTKVKKKVARKKVVKKRITKKRPARKTPARKQARKQPKKKQLKKKQPKKPAIKTQGKAIGLVTHYFPHVQAAVIKLKSPLAMGDKIRIKGHTTDFTQVITSMQIDRADITQAKPGQEIGLLVNSRVRQNDVVTKAQ